MEYRCLLWDFDGTCRHWQRRVEFLTYAARRAGGAIDDLYMRDDANLADPMDEIMRHVIPYPGEAYLETLMRMYAYTTARSMIFRAPDSIRAFRAC
mgnify:CR=1 FL=1